jgi:hypothetical protein
LGVFDDSSSTTAVDAAEEGSHRRSPSQNKSETSQQETVFFDIKEEKEAFLIPFIDSYISVANLAVKKIGIVCAHRNG